MMPHVPVRRVAALVLAGLLLALVVPGMALAHAELVTPTPADKSTSTQPVPEVSGIFSAAMRANGSTLVVKDATGATVAEGGLDPANDARMVAKPAVALGIGAYTVQWTSVATDGDVERGTWQFVVAVVATPAPTPAPTAAPTAAATAAPTAAPTPLVTLPPTAAPSAPSGPANAGSTSDVVLPIVVALILLGAGAAYLLTRRNRPVRPT